MLRQPGAPAWRALAVAAALAVTGCGGDDRAAPGSTGAAPPGTSVRPAVTAPAGSAVRGRCVAAPQPLVAQILGKLRTTGAPVLRHAYGYRPRETQGVVFIAGVPGGSGEVAVWVTREGPGRTVVYAVNREARRASAWGTGGAVGRTLSTVPGAGRAAACARRAAG